MSIRQGMLALLAEQPLHGYQLRQEFEHRTGGTWPLNIGQVYTTLHRLVRDGLVEPVPASRSADGGGDVERFQLTAAGHSEITEWWSTPVDRGSPARDELVIKMALAVTAPGVDVGEVIQAQRRETMRVLRDYTRLKGDLHGSAPGDRDGLAWTLVLDNLVFAAEAEIRWLDHVEARVARSGASRSGPAADVSSSGGVGTKARDGSSADGTRSAAAGRTGAAR